MPRSDAGHVTKAAGGQAEQGAVLFGTVRRRIHHRGRDEVRHVGHHGHEPVVVGGRKDQHIGAQAGHDALQPIEGLQLCRRGRRQRPDRPHEEVGIGTVQSGLLRPGHRMAADEPRMIRLFHDGGLDPAHVGDHRIGQPPVFVEEATCHGADGGRRHRDEDDFRPESRHRRRR